MDLPLDVIPGTNPPKFRWNRVVDTVNGKRLVECEGMMPASSETAIVQLLDMIREQQAHIADLKRINTGLADRVAAQSELLSQRAEKSPTPPPANSDVGQMKPQQKKR